jgi:hypothetical protein
MTARAFEPRDIKNCIMSDREHERMNDTLVNCRNNLARAVVALTIGLLLAGCTSFARGVTEAMLSRESEDTRMCEAEGVPFEGIEPYLSRQDSLPPIGDADSSRPQVKVVYVHGIGTHRPGHGTELMQNLTRSLALDVRSPRPKTIALVHPENSNQSLGELTLFRFTDEYRKRDLVFYELTWSSITQPSKESIAFDESDVYRSRRASVNQAMRSFINDIAPDPIAFAGNKGGLILTAIGQTLCWAMSTTWSQLPESTAGKSCELDSDFGSRATIDEFAFITHSLGSRAIMDSLQTIARRAYDPDVWRDRDAGRLTEALRERELQLFMLSNQLPLLEAGQDPQEITGAEAEFCGPDALRSNERFFKRLQMVAFSDPNDVMSYPVPETWVQSYVDSRLCPKVTNITINIANVRSLPGLGTFADPLAAHTGYDEDERVGGLMAKGAGHADVAPIVRERCTWIATDENLMR